MLAVSGAYRPPLGALGAGLDRAIMHRIAEATIRIFTNHIGAAIIHPAASPQQDMAGYCRKPGPSPRHRDPMPWRATRSVADEVNGWVRPSGNGSPGCRRDRSDEGSPHAVRRGDNTGGAASWDGARAEARHESPCSRPQASGGAHNGLSQVCAPSAAAAQRGARLTGRTTLTRAARSLGLLGSMVDGIIMPVQPPTASKAPAFRSCRSRSAPAGAWSSFPPLTPRTVG